MNEEEKNREIEDPGLKMENKTIEKEPDLGLDQSEINEDKQKERSSAIGFPTRSFSPGDVIFEEGDPGNEAYLILEGQVKITRRHQKKRIVVSQLEKDQIFGEMAIITGESRTATAEAVAPTEVFVITEDKLNENLSQHMAIVKTLIDQLIHRLKQVMRQQGSMVTKVERSLQTDKKLKKIKTQAKEYEQAKSPAEMDQGLLDLFQMIRDI